MTVMDHIRRNGKYYLLAIAVFFAISIFGGFGVGNFGSTMSGPRNQQQEQQQQVRELSNQLSTFARLNDREIDTATVMRTYNRLADAQMRRGQAPGTPQERGELMQRVLDNMFRAEYLISYGQENGVEVTRQEVDERLNQQIMARLQQDSEEGRPHIFKDIQESIRMWQGREQALQQILSQTGLSEQEYRQQLKRSMQIQRSRQKFLSNQRESLKQERMSTAEQVKQQLDNGELSWADAVAQHHAEDNATEDNGLIESPIGRNSFPSDQEGTDSLYEQFLKPRPDEGSIAGPFFLGDGIYIFKVENWVELDPDQVSERKEEIGSEMVEQLGLSGTSEITDEQVIAFERKAKVRAIKFPAQFQQSAQQELQEQVDQATKVVYHPFLNAWRAEQGFADWSEEAVKNNREFTQEQKTEVQISSGRGGSFEITRTTKPRYNEAVEFMNAALELRPNYSLYNYYQAELYQRWDQAWDQYEQATQQASGEGSSGEAVPAATEGEGSGSGSAEGRQASGGSGQQSGEQPDEPWNGKPELSDDEITQKRLTLLEKASQASLSNNEYNADIHFALAKLYRERGETDKAREQLQYTIDYSGRDRELVTNAKTIAQEMEFSALVEDANTALENIPETGQRRRAGGGGGGPQIQLGGNTGGGQGGSGGQTGGGQSGGPPTGFGQQPAGEQGGTGSADGSGQSGNSSEQSGGTGGASDSGQRESGESEPSGSAQSDSGTESGSGDTTGSDETGTTESGDTSESDSGDTGESTSE